MIGVGIAQMQICVKNPANYTVMTRAFYSKSDPNKQTERYSLKKHLLGEVLWDPVSTASGTLPCLVGGEGLMLQDCWADFHPHLQHRSVSKCKYMHVGRTGFPHLIPTFPSEEGPD